MGRFSILGGKKCTFGYEKINKEQSIEKFL